ncbi:MAG TPA: YbhB/YbcL family Raf kinase inhibitor-like protein [Candidatus Sulfopaludibacter sp.]|nr:YbhB/YbcL family Raf kinase inhibitor-like protein [Candidatus Sulfopaludibacter sp.]
MNGRMSFWFAAAWFCLAAASCANDTKIAKEPAMNIPITSTAFAEGQPIPDPYTCAGLNVSPPLQWANAPAGVKSFALIADDPDAPMGTWVHWVIYNLPPAATALAENTPPAPELPDGSKQGINDFGNIGYGGPCPPPGRPHRYFFKIYALDVMLNIKSGATKKELLKAMEGHVLARGQRVGTYQRR